MFKVNKVLLLGIIRQNVVFVYEATFIRQGTSNMENMVNVSSKFINNISQICGLVTPYDFTNLLHHWFG